MHNPFTDLSEYLGLKFFGAIFAALPEKLANVLGKLLGTVAYNFAKENRSMVIRNLEIAFPDASKEEKIRIAKLAFQCLILNAVDYLRGYYLSWDNFKDKFIIEGKNYLDEIYKEKQGLILATGHFGNWELLGAYLAKEGYPLNVVVREQSNILLEALFNHYRLKNGLKIINRQQAGRAVLKKLKDGEFVGILFDQDARKNGIFVDFFNKKASTYYGPASFALKTNSPIIFCIIRRRIDGGYYIRLDAPIYPEKLDEDKRNIKYLTQYLSSRLEKEIRAYPKDWFWFHNRWRTQPEDKEEPEEEKGEESGLDSE